jgi:uncharacterized membrane protein
VSRAEPARAARSLWRDFGWALAGALALLGLIWLGEAYALSAFWPLGLPRLALGLLYVLYVPGYLLQAALFPRRDDLDGIERAGLSLGLSVAWVPVLALILDGLPWGIRLWPIVIGQGLSMLLFMAVAAWRRKQLPLSEAYAPELRPQPKRWWAGLSPLERRLYRISAGALLLAALAAAWVFLVPSPADFMTEFYMLGQGGLAEDFPRQAQVGQPLQVTLGLRNLERSEQTYRVQAYAVDPWESQRQLVAEQGPVQLAVGAAYEQPITWQMPKAGQDQQVEFLLFIEGQAEPYRRLVLWLDVED